jgi:HAD superfamily hydrolase (TIGR01509 family)
MFRLFHSAPRERPRGREAARPRRSPAALRRAAAVPPVLPPPRRGGATLRAVFEAIFWDNDGVLVDTEALYYRATREVLARVGVALSEDDFVELFLRQARGAWHLAEARGLPAERLAQLRRERDDRYSDLLEAGPIAIPGAADAVRRLAARHRMAIVTSCEPEHFQRIHRDAGFLALFEFILTRNHYGESKPHPEPYLRALERTGLPPERCLVIEDSERGLRAAKAAGLTCWVVPTGLTRRCRFDGADRVLAGLDELEAALAP